MKSFSKAIHELIGECEKLEARNMSILRIRISEQPVKCQVHVSFYDWMRFCGADREWHHEIFSDRDSDKPDQERIRILWFMYEGIKFYCLMTGEEMRQRGLA